MTEEYEERAMTCYTTETLGLTVSKLSRERSEEMSEVAAYMRAVGRNNAKLRSHTVSLYRTLQGH
jgi:hypothetical protein